MIHLLHWRNRERKSETKAELNYHNKKSDIDKNQSTIKIITDEPTLDDALDFDGYSRKFSNIIKNSKPQFAIGIFGEWGTGKTTLMRMIEAKLNGYLFNWNNIPGNDNDLNKLKLYLIENFREPWINDKKFIKGAGRIIKTEANRNSLHISINEKTSSVLIDINGKKFDDHLFWKNDNGRLDVYKRQEEEDILTVWFDAWKYEREKHLAIVPFLKTIELELETKLIELENTTRSSSINNTTKIKKWKKIKKRIRKTLEAFAESANININLGSYGSTQVNLEKFKKILSSDSSSIVIDNELTHYYKNVTESLEEALSKFFKKIHVVDNAVKEDFRIVVFVDDLDRCMPEKALEILESIKAFFDIKGIVYVIGMNHKSIDAIVKKKFLENPNIRGEDYMKKIVQLPFQIPIWQKVDISKSIDNMITNELEGSDIGNELLKIKNKNLIVNAVKRNPREIKRFINSIILANSIFDKPITELISVQALNFNVEWNHFLELITPNDERRLFFRLYDKINNNNNEKEFGLLFDRSAKELRQLYTDKNPTDNDLNLLKDHLSKIYRELFKPEYGDDLKDFLDIGGAANTRRYR